LSFKVDSTAAKHIKEDAQNQKLWEEAMECTSDGLQVNLYFSAVVTETLTGLGADWNFCTCHCASLIKTDTIFVWYEMVLILE
jgi:hypothetical protein